MIIDQDVNPKRNLYYLGGKVLSILAALPNGRTDVLTIFYEVKKTDEVSLKLVILALDWLYVLGVIRLTSNGGIEKCT